MNESHSSDNKPRCVPVEMYNKLLSENKLLKKEIKKLTDELNSNKKIQELM